MAKAKQRTATEITMVNVEDLIPYVNNARKHSEEQVTQIAASIKEFGFLDPVIMDGDNGILAGHGRVMAAKKLGMSTVPAVQVSHLSEGQKKAYILANNRLSELSTWDEELLKMETDFLGVLDFDMTQFGFEMVVHDAVPIRDHGTGNSEDKAFFDITKDDYENQEIKKIYLFFDDTTGQEFLTRAEKLFSLYEVENLSDLMKALVDETFHANELSAQ